MASEALELIKSREDSIGDLLNATGIDTKKFMQVVIQAFNKTPKIAQCTKQSVLAAVMEAARLGLVPAGNQCAIVPFKGKATFVIGYRGIVDLALKSSEVKSIMAECVYEGDEFHYSKGLEPELYHVPMGEDDPNKITHAYAVAKLANGEKPFEVMTKAAIDKVRNVSPAKSDGPWVTWYEEMAKKTVFKRLGKWLPQEQAMARAYRVDEVPDAMVEAGKEYDITPKISFSDVISDETTNDITVNTETGELIEVEPDENGKQTEQEFGSVVEEIHEYEKQDKKGKKKSKSEAMKKAWETRKANEAKKAEAEHNQATYGHTVNEAVKDPVLVKPIEVGPVELISNKTLESIIHLMASGRGGLEAVEYMKKYEDTSNGEMKKLTEEQGQDVLKFLQEKNEEIPY
jgi:recombination protein RecT